MVVGGGHKQYRHLTSCIDPDITIDSALFRMNVSLGVSLTTGVEYFKHNLSTI
jgi:hypothetical protein